ncbi:hypothetical protein MSAN_00547500 [Mycena sanguinolenta]|uniref:B box-type domain-containing protein n=1 Tax=Mycena sanguinolenta TaxID=230812 RepID=A0A8H6Z9D3_9AGAR|nr:hypothetical protein MSAN_00547500 [Mycena sanguinolenta]
MPASVVADSKPENGLRPSQPGHPDLNPADKDKTSLKDHFAEMASGYSSAGSEFYANNSDDVASSAASVAASVDLSEMKDKMKTLSESSKLLMKALDEVQRLHPFIGVAVLAFKAVISLGLKRKNNNANVLALQVKMQEMMYDFVQLRLIKPDHKLENGTSVRGMLSELCKAIAEDIEKCGNLCDKYSKTSFLGQLFKSPIYNERFSEFIETFERHKKELDHKMLLITTIRVHSAGEDISHIDETVKSTDQHVKTLVLLQRLQSPLQQKLSKAIKEYGGPEECLADEKIIENLVLMAQGLKPDPVAQTPFALAQTIKSPQINFVPPTPSPASHTPANYNPNAIPRPFSPANISDSNYIWSAFHPQDPVTRSFSPSNISDAPHMSFSTLRSRHSSFDQSQPASRQDSMGSAGAVAGFPGAAPLPSILHTASNPISNAAKSLHGTPGMPSRRTSFATSDDSGSVVRPQAVSPTVVAATLREEMAEDVDTGLRRNMETFTRKLLAQQAQLEALEHTIIRQSNRVVHRVSEELRKGPHNRVQDPEIKALWEEMGWKLSVPDREFVLNLHDYYLAQYSEPIDIEEYFKTPEGTTVQDVQGLRRALKNALSSAKARAEDKWALSLFTFQNIPRVLEAFDGDGSGFVSVWEVNQLTSACPEGWTVLQWVAYWILGSHWTIWIYRSKICEILQKMHQFADGIKSSKTSQFKGKKSILSANRFFVNEHLDGIQDIDKILVSLERPTELLDSHLANQFSAYADAEEKRLDRILGMLDYEIDGVDTVSLIIGRHQIERNLFPVLYLLLKRHLEILYHARMVVFDRNELASCVNSVKHILESVDFRVNNLETSHEQRSPNSASPIAKFAFGMYYRLCFGPALFTTDIFALLELSEEEIYRQYPTAANENSQTGKKPILKYKARSETHPHPPNGINDSIQLSSESTVCGQWTGHLTFHHTNNIAPYGMIQISLAPDEEHPEVLVGSGSYCAGTLDMSGKLDGGLTLTLTGIPDDPIADKPFVIMFEGNLVADNDGIRVSGNWRNSSVSQYEGGLVLMRLPTWIYRLKDKLLQMEGDRTAHSLWKFAQSAFQQHARIHRGLLPVAHLNGIRRGAELTRRHDLLRELDQNDLEEHQRLLFSLTPWEARTSRCAARTSIDYTLHKNASCSGCRRKMIPDIRHFCFDCDSNFCEICVDIHTTQHPADHGILRLHRYITSRQFVLLRDKASTILWALRANPSHTGHVEKSQHSDLKPQPLQVDLQTVSGVRIQVNTPTSPGVPAEAPSARATTPETQHPDDFEVNTRRVSNIEADNDGLAPRPLLRRSQTQSSVRSKHSEILDDTEAEDEEHPPHCCIYCRGSTHPRYWVCVICTELQRDPIRICQGCETKPRSQLLGVPLPQTVKQHDRHHALVRVDQTQVKKAREAPYIPRPI